MRKKSTVFFSLARWPKYANNERKLIGLLGSPLLSALFEHDDTLSVAISFIRVLIDAKVLGHGARLVTLDLGPIHRAGEIVKHACSLLEQLLMAASW